MEIFLSFFFNLVIKLFININNSNQATIQQPQQQVPQNWQSNQTRAITNVTKSPNQFQLHSMQMNLQSPPGMSRLQQQQPSSSVLPLNQQPYYFINNEYAVAAAQEYAAAMAAVAAMANPIFLAQNQMLQNSTTQSVNNQIPQGGLHIHSQPPPPRQSKAIQIVNPNNQIFNNP